VSLFFYGVILFSKSLAPLQLPHGIGPNGFDRNKNVGMHSASMKDPCNGTGGTGQIMSIEKDSLFTIMSRDGVIQRIKVGSQTKFRNAETDLSYNDLKKADHVTLIVETQNQDGSLNASLVLICGV
jgi:hypothetical protein